MQNQNTVELLQNGGYNLSEFTQPQIDFIMAIAKLSYREGLAAVAKTAYYEGLADGNELSKQQIIEIYQKLDEETK